MIADEVNMNQETVRLVMGDEKILCQDGAQETHTATAGCVVKRDFLTSKCITVMQQPP